MTDPAVGAAERAWDAEVGFKKSWAQLPKDNSFVQTNVAAAREALGDDPIDWCAHDFLADIADREPWRILRAADLLVGGNPNFNGGDSQRLLMLANQLEAKAAEDARQKRRIEKAVLAVPGGGDLGTIRALDEAGLLKDVDDE